MHPHEVVNMLDISFLNNILKTVFTGSCQDSDSATASLSSGTIYHPRTKQERICVITKLQNCKCLSQENFGYGELFGEVN